MKVWHRFDRVDIGEYPDIHLLPNDLDVVLWVMLVGKEKIGISELTAAEISDVATHRFLRPLSRQRAASELATANGAVVKKPKSSPARFVIMKPGIDRVMGQQSDVLLIDPSKAFSTAQKLEKLLGSLQGNVLICDPYVDDKTLVALSSIPTTSAICVLTLNVYDEAKFRGRLGSYQREYGNLEVRVSATKDIHDRYIIDGTSMWLVGTSLNEIGKKQSFVVAVGSDIRLAAEMHFHGTWNLASQWK